MSSSTIFITFFFLCFFLGSRCAMMPPCCHRSKISNETTDLISKICTQYCGLPQPALEVLLESGQNLHTYTACQVENISWYAHLFLFFLNFHAKKRSLNRVKHNWLNSLYWDVSKHTGSYFNGHEICTFRIGFN